MALTQFAFCQVGVGYGTGNIPVPLSTGVVCEAVVPTGTNAKTTAVAPAGIPEVMCRVATDTAIYVAFGEDPNALTSTTARYYIPANAIEYFRVKVGDKAAVVTV